MATHGGELTYLFNKGFFGKYPSMTKEDQTVMDAFVTSFTNFAKYGC